MFTALNVIPLLFFVVWLGLVAYVILLATRLVNAVEQIARALTQRLPESPRT
jgi:Flp pilus assembly protein TadG